MLIVAIDKNNNCCGIHKMYGGYLTPEEILDAYDVSLHILLFPSLIILECDRDNLSQFIQIECFS